MNFNFNISPAYAWLWIAAVLTSITCMMGGVWKDTLIPFIIAASITALVKGTEL